MRYRRKQSKTEKNKKCKKTKSALHTEKHRMCTQKIRKSRFTQKIKHSYRILECTVFFSGQVKCCLVHNWEFFSYRRCF